MDTYRGQISPTIFVEERDVLFVLEEGATVYSDAKAIDNVQSEEIMD